LDLIADATTSIFIGNSVFTNSNTPMSDCLITGLASAESSTIDYLFSSDGSCDAYDDNALSGDPLFAALNRPDDRLSFSHTPDQDPTQPSPLIDVAPEMSCNFFSDQYQRTRPQDVVAIPNLDGSCDLGSLEALSERLFSDRFEELLP
ncbi:MAG: hypothetical protein AAGJ52_09810, partial [Pseudomonadota bacterium]